MLFHSEGSVANETEMIWLDPKQQGWQVRVAYRWQLIHRPSNGLMRIKIFRGTDLVVDSGNQYNKALNGGKMGVYCFSQARGNTIIYLKSLLMLIFSYPGSCDLVPAVLPLQQ